MPFYGQCETDQLSIQLSSGEPTLLMQDRHISTGELFAIIVAYKPTCNERFRNIVGIMNFCVPFMSVSDNSQSIS